MEPVSMRTLMGQRDVNRRTFVVSSLGAGFALAVLPVSAQTITTSASGLVAGEVKVPVHDGSVPAYRARPAGAGPFPVVLVIQEVFGVHEWIKDVCRRLAHLGYYAIAPALYARQGDPMKVKDVDELVTKIVSQVPDSQVMADLDATAAFAAGDGGNTARMGVIGFCWGGREVLMYASHNPRLKAAVAYYGFPQKAFHDGDRYPQDLVEDNHVPTLGLYGGADPGIPAAAIKAYFDALKASGNSASEYVIYPGAPHGFLADYRPTYDKAAAQDAWKRTTAWFEARL
ncbi:MAG: dienelactone hydrolase family protein [Proteobacteria bacterium]|nr:dienelactone hydrolase family protein [Pseudomonadota bacterium]